MPLLHSNLVICCTFIYSFSLLVLLSFLSKLYPLYLEQTNFLLSFYDMVYFCHQQYVGGLLVNMGILIRKEEALYRLCIWYFRYVQCTFKGTVSYVFLRDFYIMSFIVESLPEALYAFYSLSVFQDTVLINQNRSQIKWMCNVQQLMCCMLSNIKPLFAVLINLYRVTM